MLFIEINHKKIKGKLCIIYISTLCTYAQQAIILAGFMVFYGTFNTISVIFISWQSVLLVEETGVPGENHQHAVNH
jgi:hypothetical protein